MGKNYLKASLLTLAMSVVLASGEGAKAKDNSWGHITDSTLRFQVLSNFNGEAILDRETGLIWDQCPAVPGETILSNAVLSCYNKSIGGTKGWRLPSATELMSLVTGQALPIGNPFCTYLPVANSSNNTYFWTSTLDPTDPTKPIAIWTPFNSASQATNVGQVGMPSVWCVRGGSNDSSGP